MNNFVIDVVRDVLEIRMNIQNVMDFERKWIRNEIGVGIKSKVHQYMHLDVTKASNIGL